MSDENKKESIELRDKLNNQLNNSGVRFTAVKKVAEGTFQMEILADRSYFQIPEQVSNKKGKKSGRIISRQPEAGSILERFKLNDEISNLQKRLEIGYLKDQIANPGKEISRLDTRYRDPLTNQYIDNRRKQSDEAKAVELYDRSQREYYKTGIYGSAIDLLSNFAATGFYNEINDQVIKEYYDSWSNDSKFLYTVKKIFHSLFKHNVCYIVRATGNYEPNFEGISSIPGRLPASSTKAGLKSNVAFLLNEVIKKVTGQEMSFEKFNKVYEKEVGAKTGHPLFYTILDPKQVTVTSSGFFDSPTITLNPKGMQSLKKTLETLEKEPEKLSKSTKESLKYIPSKLKEAAKNNKEYIFSDEEIAVIYLRKDDYEGYAKPRGARAFDSFDYKEELKKADYATVDGITNYILKVTIGNKDNPVTDESILDEVAEAFNTPQKAFTIVWNDTLQIEKITANEIGNILGKAKYEPVESDISAAIGMARAMIDGTNITGDAANLSAKATQSEIENARQQVEDWIYSEYRYIAKAAAFTTYPVVRWQHNVVSTDGEAVTKASYMQMLDRKAISIQTYMREMGFDFETEKQRMIEEAPLIQQDILRAGSPYQAMVAPAGSPSGDMGRPKGQPTSTKKVIDNQKTTKRKTKVESPSQQAATADEYISNIIEVLSELNEDTRSKILNKFKQEQ